MGDNTVDNSVIPARNPDTSLLKFPVFLIDHVLSFIFYMKTDSLLAAWFPTTAVENAD